MVKLEKIFSHTKERPAKGKVATQALASVNKHEGRALATRLLSGACALLGVKSVHPCTTNVGLLDHFVLTPTSKYTLAVL